jgi:disulfide oxidoreductase YuzD
LVALTSRSTKAVVHGCTRRFAGCTLADTAAEIKDWLGAACPGSTPGPPLPEYNSAEERTTALWAAVVQQLVSDAEIDAISAAVND